MFADAITWDSQMCLQEVGRSRRSRQPTPRQLPRGWTDLHDSFEPEHPPDTAARLAIPDLPPDPLPRMLRHPLVVATMETVVVRHGDTEGLVVVNEEDLAGGHDDIVVQDSDTWG